MKRIALRFFFLLMVSAVMIDGYRDMAAADCHESRCAQVCGLHTSSCGTHMLVSQPFVPAASMRVFGFASEMPTVVSLSLSSSVFHPPKHLA